METKRDLTVLVGSTPILSAMTRDEAIEKFPVGAVVHLCSNREQLMTVSRHINASDDDDTVFVEFMWFDENDQLRHGRSLPETLRVRVKNPPE